MAGDAPEGFDLRTQLKLHARHIQALGYHLNLAIPRPTLHEVSEVIRSCMCHARSKKLGQGLRRSSRDLAGSQAWLPRSDSVHELVAPILPPFAGGTEPELRQELCQ